jgi:predicted nucleic acid-binding protein
MSGLLFDTNVLIDIATGNSPWSGWSEAQFKAASDEGLILINPIIYAELAPAFSSSAALDRWVAPDLFRRLSLPYAASWLASQAFIEYRKGKGTKTSPLPDFYIGAHAALGRYTLVTRDVSRYRTYFPTVKLIHPG